MPAPSPNDRKNEPKPGYRYPDGGWGWVIVSATGLSNFITIPVMQSFALIFQKRIEDLNMSTTDLTTIINVNAAFGMGLGLFTGSFLKLFGYRKVALVGGICSFVGITSTGWAENFSSFLVTYSLITSLGTFLSMSAFSLAINTFFLERRGYASGLSTAFTGLGPVFMPQVITLLLRNYSTQGTMMILGALSAHSILAAMLLHPVKWHFVKVEATNIEEQADMLKQDSDDIKAEEAEMAKNRRNTITTNSNDLERDTPSFYGGCETPLVSHRSFGSSMQISAKRKSSSSSFLRSVSQYDDGPDLEPSKRISHISKDRPWWKSEDTINLGSSVKIFDEKLPQTAKKTVGSGPSEKKNHQVNDEVLEMRNGSVENIKNNNEEKKKNDEDSNGEKENIFLRIGRSIVAFFDLDLLTDPGYVILMIGMSLAICAELNFSLFTPLILGDYGFTIEQTATVMSVIGTSDIIFRFLAPFFGDCLKFTAQNMYLMSLIMLIATRTSLMIFHDYTSALIVAGGLGIAKGFRTVYMGLVIPSYVPLYRLPSANGIQNLVNCLFIIISIPLMAAVRDATGNFNACIGALNTITFCTVCLWTIQLLYQKYKAKREEA